MTGAELIAWVALWPLVLDGRPGQRLPRHPIPRPAAIVSVMVDAALEAEARTGVSAETFLAVEDVQFAHESGYRPGLAGDCPGMRAGDPRCTRAAGAKSCGLGQTPCRITPPGATALEEARITLRTFERWMLECPSNPLGAYMTGSCRVGLGRFRSEEIRALLATPKPRAP